MATYNATKPQTTVSPLIAITVEIQNGKQWFTFNTTLTNDGTPCRPKILKAIATQHPGFSLVTWWTRFD